MSNVPRHLRRFAKQHRQIHVHRFRLKQAVADDELVLRSSRTDHGVGTALPLAQFAEHIEPIFPDGQHVAFLCFVAPALHGRHPRLFAGNFPQLEASAHAATMDQLRQRIRQTARPYVVHGKDRIGFAHCPTAIDDLLGPTLHLSIASLHGIEVEILGILAGPHAGRRTSAQTDEHAGPAELYQRRTRSQFLLVDLQCPRCFRHRRRP